MALVAESEFKPRQSNSHHISMTLNTKAYLKEQCIHLLIESLATTMCFHSSRLLCTSAWSFHEVR